MGLVYADLSEAQKALEYYAQALPKQQSTGNHHGEGMTLNNMASLYEELGELAKALELYGKAQQAQIAGGSRSGQAMALGNMAKVNQRLGKLDLAKQQYGQALELLVQDPDSVVEAATRDDLGALYFERQEWDSALQSETKALETSREIGDKEAEAETLKNIGLVYLKIGKPDACLEKHRQALSLERSIGFRRGEAHTLGMMAVIELMQGKLSEARAHMEDSLRIVEILRTKVSSHDQCSSYFATVHDYYSYYIEILMRLHERNPHEGYDRLALEASERGHARTLLELLSEAHADVHAGANLQLLAREPELQQALDAKSVLLARSSNTLRTQQETAATKAEVDSLIAEYQDVETAIRTSSPRYASLTQPHPLTASEIQQLLDGDTVLLEYSLGMERSFL